MAIWNSDAVDLFNNLRKIWKKLKQLASLMTHKFREFYCFLYLFPDTHQRPREFHSDKSKASNQSGSYNLHSDIADSVSRYLHAEGYYRSIRCELMYPHPFISDSTTVELKNCVESLPKPKVYIAACYIVLNTLFCKSNFTNLIKFVLILMVLAKIKMIFSLNGDLKFKWHCSSMLYYLAVNLNNCLSFKARDKYNYWNLHLTFLSFYNTPHCLIKQCISSFSDYIKG